MGSVSSASACVSADVSVSGVILSPSEYVRVLNLAGGDDDSADEGDMCGEVEEINLADSAWQTVARCGCQLLAT